LGRTLTSDEYYRVTREIEKLGFTRGWVQDLQSSGFYQPDFLESNPFGS
jgi:hypothetical protein